MKLHCPNCGKVTVVGDADKAAILTQLHSPVDVHMIRCKCGMFEWAISARDIHEHTCRR